MIAFFELSSSTSAGHAERGGICAGGKRNSGGASWIRAAVPMAGDRDRNQIDGR